MANDFSNLGKYTREEGSYDIVVVGSGHNGLTTAAYLAAAGKKVLVLERQSYPGGGVASYAMAEPGYISERHSAIHVLIRANPLIENDELGLLSKFGLKYVELDPTYAIIFKKGWLPIYRDPSRTAAAIAKYSQEDAEAYFTFARDSQAIAEAVLPSCFVPPEDNSAAIAASPLGPLIAEASETSSYDVIKKYFKDETVQVALLRFVTEIQLAHPTTKGTGLMAYLAIGILCKQGLSLPEGGGTGFTNAVIRCIEHYGGKVMLDTEVIKVVQENGRAVGVRTRSGIIRAKEAVIGQFHPWVLDQMVDNLSPTVIEKAKKSELSEYTLFVIHAALEEKIEYTAGPMASTAVMNTVCGNSIKDLIHSYDEMAAGRLPDNLMIGAACTSTKDPTRAPPGKSLLHCVVMVRNDQAADKDGDARVHWNKVKDEVVQKTFKYLASFSTNFTPDKVRSYHVVTPMDHEQDSPSFQRGDISGLGMKSDQMGINRPTPELAQYRVPGVKGLYLTGPFMHPGGGVWGGGRPTAMRVLEDMGINFDKRFVNNSASARL